jgi:hypothetical protein
VVKTPHWPLSGTPVGGFVLFGLSTVKQPEPANGNTDTKRRSNRKNRLRDELAVLHLYFLSQSLDLNGHEVNP